MANKPRCKIKISIFSVRVHYKLITGTILGVTVHVSQQSTTPFMKIVLLSMHTFGQNGVLLHFLPSTPQYLPKAW